MRPDPSRLVVDSSVVVKWFLSRDESHVDEALELLDAHTSGERILAAPGHLLLEVLNVLKRRGLDTTDLAHAASELRKARLELHPVEGLATEAAAIAVQHDLTLYDAAFAALAAELDAELITEDRRRAGSGACRVRQLGT